MAERQDVEPGGRRPDEHLGDDIAALVLGDVDGGRRAAMAAHVLRCAECRRDYDELAETVEGLLVAVPGVQPPIGFDERVLARLAPSRSMPRRRAPRRSAWMIGVAAALVAVVVALGAWAVTRPGGGDSAAAGDIATLHLSDGGTPVGTVSVSEVDGRTVMVVALVTAPDEIRYYCRARLADGTMVESEAWPAGSGAWIVPLPDASAPVTSVEVLPEGTDHIWSAASFT